MNGRGFKAGANAGKTGVVPAIPLRLAGAWRFFRDWAGMSGAYLATGHCPCCGQAGCPVGFLNAGIVGALLAGAVRLMSRCSGKRAEQGK